MRLGIIARSDNTGLGNQTKELVEMLQPDKVLLINSTPFNKNQQFPERYNNYDVTTSIGFLNSRVAQNFIQSVDVVLTCETFYSNAFVQMAKKNNVKTVLQYNYEFLDYLQNNDMPLPDILLAPSQWNIEDVISKFGSRCEVKFLPPPTDPSKFTKAREANGNKTKRILHVAGKIAHNDRNGTQTVIEMMKYSKANYELVIASQSLIDPIDDPRVTIDYGNKLTNEELYLGYDALILPRRYAGLCLPMNEALVSGLPVFMTDISPNNKILPPEWLVPARHLGSFMTRTNIDYYEADPKALAELVDKYIESEQEKEKAKAVEISKMFYPENLLGKYQAILFSQYPNQN